MFRTKGWLMIFAWVLALNLAWGYVNTWDWCTHNEGSGGVYSYGLAVDDSNYVYSIGSFWGAISLGDFNLQSCGPQGENDLYVAKQSPEGAFIWVALVQYATQGSGSTDIRDIAIDSQNNIYVTGYYAGNKTFGTQTLTGDNQQPFIAKLNTQGDWIWARKAISYSTSCNSYHMALDSQGNVIITGTFRNRIDFGTTTLTGETNNDSTFVAWMSPEGNWLRAVKPQTSFSFRSITTGLDDRIYLTQGMGSSYGGNSYSILVLNSNGVVQSYPVILGLPQGGTILINDIQVDVNSNVYVVAYFSHSVTIGGTEYLSSNGSGLVMKFNNLGEPVWIRQHDNSFEAIELEETGNLYCWDSAGDEFGPFDYTEHGTSSHQVLAKLDTDGNWLWVKGIGTDGWCKGLAIDNLGDIIVGGQYGNFLLYDDAEVYEDGTYLANTFIAKTKPYVLRETSPVNGEVVQGNSQVEITWEATCLVPVIWLDYSLDNGATWLPVYQYNYSADIGSYLWTVPNVGTTQAKIQLRSFSHPTVFALSEGCFTIAEQFYPPVADFTADVTNGLDPLTVQFTDLSQAVSGSLQSWQWDFGDGGSSTEQNPSHTYTEFGVYSVSLTVTNTANLSDTENKQAYINVTSALPLLSAQPSSAMSFGSVFVEESSVYQALNISNQGGSDLLLSSVQLNSNPSNFEFVLPDRDVVIAPGQMKSILVKFSPLELGSCVDTLLVANNSCNLPLLKIRLSGTGLDVPPNPPENVVMVMNGIDAVLSWDAVTENSHGQPMTPDYYFVYFNGSENPEGLFYFLGRAFGTSYTHFDVGLGAEHMFYRVKAIKLYREGQSDAEKADKDTWLSTALKQGMSEAEVMQVLQSYSQE